MVVRALRAVGVPVRVITDFDVLRDERTISKLVQAQGSDWANLQKDWTILASNMHTVRGPRTLAEARQRIIEVIDSAEANGQSSVDDKLEQEVRSILRVCYELVSRVR
jgi:hypothetical protein